MFDMSFRPKGGEFDIMEYANDEERRWD